MEQRYKKRMVMAFACLSAGLLLGYSSYAQLHAPDLPQNRALILAEEQYQLGNYELAKQFAHNYLQQQENGTLNPVF